MPGNSGDLIGKPLGLIRTASQPSNGKEPGEFPFPLRRAYSEQLSIGETFSAISGTVLRVGDSASAAGVVCARSGSHLSQSSNASLPPTTMPAVKIKKLKPSAAQLALEKARVDQSCCVLS